MFIPRRKIINKNVTQKSSRLQPCGTPDNAEKKEENFPKTPLNNLM
jgi:hypothetical protein